MFNEAIQFTIIQLNEFPDLQIEDFPQLGDLHDVHMFGFNKVFQMDGSECPLPRKGEEI